MVRWRTCAAQSRLQARDTMLLSNRIDRRPGVLARSLAGSLARRLRLDSLLRNSIYVMSSTAVTATSGYLYWMMATHIYHPADVGLASALVATVMLASTGASLGAVPTLIQVLPRPGTGYPGSLTLNTVLMAGTVARLRAVCAAPVLLPRSWP